MAENQLREMISAFASGCMDRENFIQFKEYLDAGGSLPKKEMGELQNTMALVPIILDLEKPNPELKNRVAKKLLSLQDEIKKKIKEKKEKLEEEKAKGNLSASEADIDFPDFEPTFTTKEIETLKTLERKKTTDRKTAKKQTREESDKHFEITGEGKTSDKKKKGLGVKKELFGWIAASIMLILVVLTYFYMSTDYHNLEKELVDKSKQLETLQKELVFTKELVSEYKELIQFLKSKNNYIVELTGDEQYPSALGRLIISFGTGDGILILDNPPKLEEDEAYQLWMVTRGKSISLGTLQKDKERLYYFIYNIPKLTLSDIDLFRITNEPKEGSIIPLGKTLLYGNIPKF